ncbi:MAG: methionyl-tRNA formyltransferase [Clostridium sp.]
MKIVFMGTPEFAVPSLKRVHETFGVESVFTQPDKPKGRGKKVGISEVKEEALTMNVPIYQPIKLRDDKEAIQYLKDLKPDFIIVVAYGQILTKEVLDIPKYGCINLHGSLLPMYRGAAPLNWVIINGEKVSGNTTMLMDVGLDTGDMLLTDKTEITENMTAAELHDILMMQGAETLVNTIKGLVDGTITPIKQEGETFYAKMLDKDLACIDWNKTAQEIHNLIRGLNSWPIAYTNYCGQRMKIFNSKVLSDNTSKKSGTILDVDKNGIKVACGNGTVLLIEKIQFPNGKPLTISQYLNGNTIDCNIVLE